NMKRIAVFASGSGSNFESLVQFFQNHASIQISLLLSHSPAIGAIERANRLDIPFVALHDFRSGEEHIRVLTQYQIDGILLAGYLKKIPEMVAKMFAGNILNVHPALIPAYSGKGMYGMNIHRAVIAAQESYSGLTIHEVNENYDEGKIIFQYRIRIPNGFSAEELAALILRWEHYWYPRIAELYFER
ncbi:MAG: phosphoribosylglycinamide formyltransferase, partial [Bacteroidia bacterium]|nr:phosphoribosylglycinamide formyltransferase [Bacteroidia bacterium]